MPSTILRDSSANFARNNSLTHNSRYNALRDAPNGDSRSRSPSVKRKANDNAYANAAKRSLISNKFAAGISGIRIVPPSPEPIVSAENLELIELNSAKVASICEKLGTSILAIPEENPVCPILRDFCAIVHIQSENSKILIDAIRKASAASVPNTGSGVAGSSMSQGPSDSEMESDSEPLTQMVSLGRLPKARNSLLPSQPRGRQLQRVWAPTESQEQYNRIASPSPAASPAEQSFKDLVKDAEKSTVIFNLDMGRVPVINKSTMSMKATSALTSMAAAAEDRPASNPSRDTVDAIDDAISVADSVSFFGRTTKSVKGKGENSGSYCTIPVCYTFPDRETRIKAEQVLRTRCKASCATPYPQSLRECIKKVLENGRRARPDDFCSVSVDIPKLSLRVAWRGKGTSEWSRHGSLIPIPEAAILVPSKVPEGGYSFVNLPFIATPLTTGSPPGTRPAAIRNANSFFDTIDTSANLANPP